MAPLPALGRARLKLRIRQTNCSLNRAIWTIAVLGTAENVAMRTSISCSLYCGKRSYDHFNSLCHLTIICRELKLTSIISRCVPKPEASGRDKSDR